LRLHHSRKGERGKECFPLDTCFDELKKPVKRGEGKAKERTGLFKEGE